MIKGSVRKIRIASLLIIAALGSQTARAASAFDAAVEANPGLVGYYPFTSTSQADSVVNGYTGVLQNSAVIGGPGSGPPTGDPNSSALILNNGANGTSYAIAGGANPLIGQIGTSGSIIAYINLASLPSSEGRIFSIAGESQVGNDLDLQINSDNILSFYTDSGSRTSDPTAFTASDLNKWVFIAATFTAGSDRNLYVDGVLVGSSVPGGHSINSSPFYQGESNVFTGRYFDGALSDVGIYNTDLNAAQVAAIYAASSVGPVVSGVPEPSTWAMMLVGFGGLGFVAYVRTRKGHVRQVRAA